MGIMSPDWGAETGGKDTAMSPRKILEGHELEIAAAVVLALGTLFFLIATASNERPQVRQPQVEGDRK